MAKSRKFLTAGAVGVAAIALIGAGAGATFTDSVHATQSITGGTLSMTVTGGASTNGKTVTFAALPAVASTFTTGPQTVMTTNVGNIEGRAIKLSASHSSNNSTLLAGLYVEIDSWSGPNQTGQHVVAFNGKLSTLENTPLTLAGPIQPTQTDPFQVTFYAGTNGNNTSGATDVGYGNPLDNGDTLLQLAQGGVVIPTITVDYEG